MPSYNDSYSNYVDIKGRAERTVYVPPDMGEIMFLGCKCGDEPITLRCGCCGYNGPSTVTKARGPANIITKVATLGIVRNKALETVHGCPGCNKDVAYSKPF